MALREALAQASAGRTVRIAGTIDRISTSMTLVLCRPGECCNETRADLRIFQGPAPTRREHAESAMSRSVLLSSTCRGDDSAVCCGYELGKPIKVTGTWRHESRLREPVWQLEPVSVCVP